MERMASWAAGWMGIPFFLLRHSIDLSDAMAIGCQADPLAKRSAGEADGELRRSNFFSKKCPHRFVGIT